MQNNKKEHPKEKARLHIRNKNRERYNFKLLLENSSELTPFVKNNIYGDESIDFANPNAVKALNKAILKSYYGINYWDIPDNYLCPPIPGRADYIHHIADLLCKSNFGKIPTGDKIVCLDIGVGANCIYPIIGTTEYGWSFIGSDIDPVAIESAKNIVENNELLKDKVECKLQSNSKDCFYGVIGKEQQIDISICNPPFHSSAKDAQAGTMRKLRNLSNEKVTEVSRNFGGQNNELWCDGGEERFVRNMVRESKKFSTSCFWFSTLISKQSNLKSIYAALKQEQAIEVVTIPMGQGNKTSRIVAWTFLSKEDQKVWKNSRWNKIPKKQ